ncbi:MAG TPA: alpha/beta fold hydrolase [Burkholderiaceae bacterium]|nr:alpha/beta fold hydrolase [Burkholderiaceae bacterium]
MSEPIRLHFSELRVPLKATFRHASAARTHGESLWVEAARGAQRGYGEGCPRAYVTGETRASCRQWLGTWQQSIERECTSIETLRAWLAEHTDAVDASPSAWCAIECALLDLFAREREQSVEALLGRPQPGGPHVYSAVIGNDELWKTRFLIDQYCILGLSDFKVKLEGELEVDREKLNSIAELTAWHGLRDVRVRVDANNLWADTPERAQDYLRALDCCLFGVEEPVRPRDIAWQSRISVGLETPVILDESLCRMADLERYDGVPGRFIANLKVSRVGGVLRALRLVEALRTRGWPIIIGAHVGETSVLTRAAMLVAAAAGDHLAAQEGAFGSRLIEREPVSPSLKWGRGGRLDLRRPYAEVTTEGLQLTPPQAWSRGWGLTCRTARRAWAESETVATQKMSDGYDIHYRLWGPERGSDVLVVLHGGMSHSAWQRPLANAVRARSEMTVFAPDRRGCGLNGARGDLASAERSIEDVIEHLRFLAGRFERIHLAGWCQGAQYAAVAAQRLQDEGALATLLLITPGLFWNARFRSVIDMAERVVQALLTHFELAPEREQAFAPIPLQATDFTNAPDGLDFIDADALKTTEVTLKSVVVMDEVQERSWEAILDVRLPVFALTATGDRIVDNLKVRAYLAQLLAAPGNRTMELDAGHAVQFERPDELAHALLDFIRAHGAPA